MEELEQKVGMVEYDWEGRGTERKEREACVVHFVKKLIYHKQSLLIPKLLSILASYRRKQLIYKRLKLCCMCHAEDTPV